jgi:hypothetical protein
MRKAACEIATFRQDPGSCPRGTEGPASNSPRLTWRSCARLRSAPPGRSSKEPMNRQHSTDQGSGERLLIRGVSPWELESSSPHPPSMEATT